MASYLEHMAIRVRDLDWHISFFEKVFGMTVKKQLGKAPNRKVWLQNGLQLNETTDFEGPEGRADHLGIMTDDVNEALRKAYELDTFQTNHEGEMVDKIHEAYYAGYDGVIINPGAWTHYSYAIHDALEILECPIIEVHMSNIFNREGFRSNSVIAPVATGMIAGMEEYVYTLAIRALKDMLD